jgi:Chalcone isomerase-like
MEKNRNPPPPQPRATDRSLLARRTLVHPNPLQPGLRQRHCIFVLLLAALLFPETAVARSIAGVDLPNQVKVDGHVLALRSCGVRDTLWVEHYVAAMYLPADAPAAPAMLDPDSPMAILLHITSTAMLPEDVPEQWREPLRKELSSEPLSKVREAYSRLSVGDRVQLNYSPKAGVIISVNGTVVSETASRSLIDSMLRTWAGKDPIAGKLRRLLLKYPC